MLPFTSLVGLASNLGADHTETMDNKETAIIGLASLATKESASYIQQGSKCGPGYTNVEDILVCKAFIAASEDPIVGSHQKGKNFKAKMHKLYSDLIKEQAAADQALLSRSSAATQEEYMKQGVGRIYPDCTVNSVYNRFKGAITPKVMKFMGIQETTDVGTGRNLDDHQKACLELFKKRQGHTFDFLPHYHYLKDKNKFSTFCTKTEEEAKGKWPTGKKRAKQAEADSKLVKAIVSQVVGTPSSSSISSTITHNGMGDMLQNISNVISNVGTALLENMRTEQEMHLAQELDTPDRKAYVKEQMALRIAETCNKRHKLEMDSHKLEKDDVLSIMDSNSDKLEKDDVLSIMDSNSEED